MRNSGRLEKPALVPPPQLKKSATVQGPAEREPVIMLSTNSHGKMESVESCR
jgi:hypothetical protein